MVAPTTSVQFLNGSKATQFVFVPANSLQPVPIPPAKKRGYVKQKPPPILPAPAPTVPTPIAPEFLWSRESKMSIANRIVSEATTMFLETMLQPDILSYIQKGEGKKIFFIKVYEELKRKGFPLDVRSSEEGGAKVWQKWRNLERMFNLKTQKIIQKNEQRGRVQKGHLKYPHYNFVLIKNIIEYFKKNYKSRKPKEVKNEKKEVGQTASNKIETKAQNNTTIVILKQIDPEPDNVDETKKTNKDNKIKDDPGIKKEKTECENVKESTNNDDDEDYDDELLKQFECNMSVDEEEVIDVKVTNDHEYVRTRQTNEEQNSTEPGHGGTDQKSETTPPHEVMFEQDSMSSTSESSFTTSLLPSSTCCPEVHDLLKTMNARLEKCLHLPDKMEEFMKEQTRLLKEDIEERKRTSASMKEVLEQQTRIIEENIEEGRRTNAFLEQILEKLTNEAASECVKL